MHPKNHALETEKGFPFNYAWWFLMIFGVMLMLGGVRERNTRVRSKGYAQFFFESLWELCECLAGKQKCYFLSNKSLVAAFFLQQHDYQSSICGNSSPKFGELFSNLSIPSPKQGTLKRRRGRA